MKRTTVHNLIIVDASGSMSSIYSQALTGINETIQTIYLVDQHDPYVAHYFHLPMEMRNCSTSTAMKTQKW